MRKDLKLGDGFLSLLLFFSALIVYLPRAAITVQPSDGGELATAVILRRIIHPPGYPLYSLLASWYYQVVSAFFTSLTPYEILATFSAVSQAGAASVLLLAARALGAPHLVAFCLGVSWAFLWPTVLTATDVEVFALHHLIVVSALYFTFTLEKFKRIGLSLLALIIGAGVLHHHTIILWSPLFFAILWPKFAASSHKILFLLRFFLPLLLPQLLYFSLFFQEKLGFVPPTSLSELLGYFFRLSYGSFALVPAKGKALEWSGGLIISVIGTGAPIYFVGIVASLFFALKYRKPLYIGFFLSIILHLLFLAKLWLPISAVSEDLWISRFFPLIFIPFTVSVAFLSSLVRPSVLVLGTLTPLFIFFPLALQVGDAKNDLSVYGEVTSFLRELPKGAFLLAGGDTVAMGLAYSTLVEKFRPDVTIIPFGLIDEPRHQEELKKSFKLNIDKHIGATAMVGALYNSNLPLFATPEVEIKAPYRAVTYGLTNKIVLEGNYPTIPEVFERLILLCENLPPFLQNLNQVRPYGKISRDFVFIRRYRSFIDFVPKGEMFEIMALIMDKIKAGEIEYIKKYCKKRAFHIAENFDLR
jgi:hypothetical protein